MCTKIQTVVIEGQSESLESALVDFVKNDGGVFREQLDKFLAERVPVRSDSIMPRKHSGLLRCLFGKQALNRLVTGH
jgi:hypothetical protein